LGQEKYSSIAFLGCSKLTTIDIPRTVRSISRYAFSGCSGLTNITIPSSVTSIEGGTFASSVSQSHPSPSPPEDVNKGLFESN